MLPEKSSQSEQRRVLERMRDFLEKDMRHVLDDRGIDASKYADTIEFTDPITNIQGKTQYLLAIQAIRLAMRPKVGRERMPMLLWERDDVTLSLVYIIAAKLAVWY